MKTQKKNSWIWKLIFEDLRMEETLRVNCKIGDLLYEFPAESGWRFTAGSTYGTIAKPARADPAQNDELPPENNRFDKVFCGWNLRKPTENLGAYIEDQYRCDKIWESQCPREIDGVPDFQKFWENDKFHEKIEKMRIDFF